MTTKKLRIAVWHNLPSGGGKRALWHHISGLLKRGHQVESWCPPTADTSYLPLNQICRDHVVPLAMPGRIRYLSWLADYHFIKSRIQAMRAHSRECAAQIQAGGFDVLLANTCSWFAVPAIGRCLQIPKVVYLQEPRRRFYEALPELPWAAPAPAKSQAVTGLPRLLASTLRLQGFRVQMREEKENAKNFDRVLVNSFFSRESVQRAYGLESEVCYLGIDTELFRPLNDPVEKYIIGVGSVNYHKGVDRAVRAVAAVPAALRPKLLWVGNMAGDEYVSDLRELAKRLAVDFEVKVMVPDAELVSLLGRAAVMLYTSRLEPFGLAPLEANACGTPVVAIAEGGVRESIVPGENGLLVPDAKPESIAAALGEIIGNPARAAGLRSQCRPAVLSRWSVDAAAGRLETMLREVVDGPKIGGAR
jgi:glycosyltransferase involved in cell wall biosynthesis